MDKIKIGIDSSCGMFYIEINGEHVFYGNNQDFYIPHTLIGVLSNLNADLEVDNNWESKK
jgi:hypothetical protein